MKEIILVEGTNITSRGINKKSVPEMSVKIFTDAWFVDCYSPKPNKFC